MSSRQAPQARKAETAPVTPTRPVQAKLEVGAADDPLEREADALADAFVRWQGSGVLAGGPASAGPEAANRTPRVHRAATVADPMGAFTAPAEVEQRIAAARGGGAALPDAQRASFEAFFGTDLSSVRVHRGAESADLNRAISARAFTTGTDVFLGAGEGGGAEGQRLLAHELTHVVQQSGGASRTVRRDPTATAAAPGTKGAKGAGKADAAGESANLATDLAEGIDPGAASTTTGADKESAAGMETSGVALGAGLLALFAAYGRVSKMLSNSNNAGEEKLFEGLEDVAAAGATVKGALSVAEAATGALAATVIPGMDVAVASVMTLVHVGRLLQLKSSFTSQKALQTALKTKFDAVAGDEKAKAPLEVQLAAVGNLLRETRKAIYVDTTRLVGDLFLVGGSAVALGGVTGPLGAALKIVGGAIEVAAGLGNWIAESQRAGETQESRDNYDAAMMAALADTSGASDAEFHQAEVDRADKDVSFAVDELFGLLAGNQLTGEELVALQGTFAAFGVGPKWLDRYEKSEVQAKESEEARAMVLGVLGAAEDPKTISQKIVGGIKKFGKWIASKFSSKDKDKGKAAAAPATPAAATV